MLFWSWVSAAASATFVILAALGLWDTRSRRR
jgi:hypothetical protein